MSDSVNLEENIPGCEDNYYRFIMKVLRISRGWIDLFSTLALMAIAIIGALAAGVNSNPNLTFKLNVSIAIISGVGAALRALKQFTVDDEVQTRALLQQIISEHDATRSHQS
jgi:hypothetical protein